jgi:SAM-dependent methyltransferase
VIEKDYKQINHCLLCGNKTTMVLPLVPTPPANELLETKQKQDTFPLNMVKCTKCNHLQIDAIVSKERLYRHYLYCSDTSAFNRLYFAKYANEMIDLFLKKDIEQSKATILDIASNDGLFLSYFKKQGFKVIGVDPAKNIAAKATKDGVPTIAEFFNKKTANIVLKEHGKISLITCNNAFAHNDMLQPMLNGIKMLLSDDGTFVFEVSYAISLLKNGLFDLIYSEHVHHHHLLPLLSFFEANGLRIYDAEERPTHGGSIRVYACLKDARFGQTERLEELVQAEQRNFDSLVIDFVRRVQRCRDDVISLLVKLKKEGKTISVLGYPAKATTILYYFGLDNAVIDDIFDDNPLKIGKYSPGGHFKLLPTSDIYTRKPDYLLILAWNYAEVLMKTHEKIREWGGKFIIPLPELKIVE